MGDNSDTALDLGGSAAGLGGASSHGPPSQALPPQPPGTPAPGDNDFPSSPPKSSSAKTPATPSAASTSTTAAAAAASANAVNVTARAKRRREEAVRRLVADVQARHKLGGTTTTTPDGTIVISNNNTDTSSSSRESQDWIIASTVAVALERGLDRDLHHELVQEAKENSGRIGQVCHDHSDVFLASVGKVVALGGPSADLANKLRTAQEELELRTAGPMQQAAMLWEEATASHARARALYVMVQGCHKVAIQLEKARKQAALGRPRGALEAVDEARTALTVPMSSLFYGKQMEHANAILKDAAKKKLEEEKKDDGPGTSGNNGKGIMSLEETPFGRRASLMLPKIENEVLMGARRGLNRWFLNLRSGGDGAKAGRAVLRRCAHSLAVGPGNLGLGGHMPPAYLWRAKVCDNLISRMNQNGRVVRSVRAGYWFERDAPKEAQRLESTCPPGMERRAEG
jgi:exocyst complex component 6